MKQCEECEGQGYYSIGPECGYPASMCCGGCYKEVTCNTCEGSGKVLTEEEEDD
jgi:hypothetical protein